MIRKSPLLFCLCIPALIGCTTQTLPVDYSPDMVANQWSHHIIVPFFPQDRDQCGPASLASVLKFYSIDINPDEISREIYLPGIKGTLNIDLVFYARSKGLSATAYHGDMADLKRQIAQGRPLLLFLNLGFKIFPVGHYIVITGFNDRDNIIYAHSGAERDKPIPYSDFMHAWGKGDFWTLLIRPKI